MEKIFMELKFHKKWHGKFEGHFLKEFELHDKLEVVKMW